MDHSVDVVFNFDERTVAGHVADFALDAAAGRIFLREDFPRIACLLAESERDLLAFLVDVEHNSFDFFADADHITGFGDALGPGHFGDMDQTFDPLFDFDECTVRHDVDNTSFDDVADGIFGFDFIPRVLGFLFESERNALFLEVDIEDHDFDLLTEFEHFGRMGDSAPGHICDMEKSVYAAEIDERTEIGDVLDDALADLADFHFLEKCGSAILAGLFEELASGNDDILAVLIDLEDLEVIFFADELVHVLDGADINLGAGEERLDAVEVDDDTAFDTVFHESLDDAAFAVFGCDLFPGLDEVCLGETDLRHIIFILDRFEENVHIVADLSFTPVSEFCAGDKAFRLVADVYESTVLSFLDNFAGNDGALGEVVAFFGAVQQFVHGDIAAQINIAFCVFCCHFVVFFVLFRYLVRKLPAYGHRVRTHL